jgi:acyl-CoA thioester hydrolase
MGYVYHGNYARYYHISRDEFLREIGISNKNLEKHTIFLPVISLNIKYLRPIAYDDVITIKTTLLEKPSSRMKFKHEVFNQKNELVNQANSTVVFVNTQTRKPMRVPAIVSDKLNNYMLKQVRQ